MPGREPKNNPKLENSRSPREEKEIEAQTELQIWIRNFLLALPTDPLSYEKKLPKVLELGYNPTVIEVASNTSGPVIVQQKKYGKKHYEGSELRLSQEKFLSSMDELVIINNDNITKALSDLEKLQNVSVYIPRSDGTVSQGLPLASFTDPRGLHYYYCVFIQDGQIYKKFIEEGSLRETKEKFGYLKQIEKTLSSLQEKYKLDRDFLCLLFNISLDIQQSLKVFRSLSLKFEILYNFLEKQQEPNSSEGFDAKSSEGFDAKDLIIEMYQSLNRIANSDIYDVKPYSNNFDGFIFAIQSHSIISNRLLNVNR